MATLLSCDCHVVPVALPGIQHIDVFHRRDGDVGRSFFVVQTFLIAALGLSNGVRSRKKEKRRGWLDDLALAWHVASSDFVHGDMHSSNSIRTTVLGSRIIMPWLFMKLNHF